MDSLTMSQRGRSGALSVCLQDCIRKCVLRSFKNFMVTAVCFQDRPVTRSPSPNPGETTAAVLSRIRNIHE